MIARRWKKMVHDQCLVCLVNSWNLGKLVRIVSRYRDRYTAAFIDWFRVVWSVIHPNPGSFQCCANRAFVWDQWSACFGWNKARNWEEAPITTAYLAQCRAIGVLSVKAKVYTVLEAFFLCSQLFVRLKINLPSSDSSICAQRFSKETFHQDS